MNIDPDTMLIVLGISERVQSLSIAQRHFISYGLMTAKKFILMFWKKVEAPLSKLWLTKLTNILHLERLRPCSDL